MIADLPLNEIQAGEILIGDPPVKEARESEAGVYVFRDEAILGTRMQIQLAARNHADALAAAIAARAEVDRLNAIFNTRDPNSEISRLNRSATHVVSPELFAVISSAERFREQTQGAFSGRLGLVIDRWRDAAERNEMPDRVTMRQLARAAEESELSLDAVTRTIVRPPAVEFALDAFAKGWIVDRAFEVACAAAGVDGALIDIGGDIRCGGVAPNIEGWNIGVADPLRPFDNAPLVATVQLQRGGIATSGRGPRDLQFGMKRHSPTLSPRDGWPVAHHIAATVIAPTAADADALATALMVAPTLNANALLRNYAASARLTNADGRGSWMALAATETTARAIAAESQNVAVSNGAAWHENWQALATFTAPRRQLIRDPDFRSPYMAMWITDRHNNPIRTLILIGKNADWQKDNFIWWSMHRTGAERLMSTRSMSTSGAGVYNVFWDGVDDAGKHVPPGVYVLHVETSRERGKHTYRSLELDFGTARRFVEVLPPTEEGGGLRVSFDHY